MWVQLKIMILKNIDCSQSDLHMTSHVSEESNTNELLRDQAIDSFLQANFQGNVGDA